MTPMHPATPPSSDTPRAPRAVLLGSNRARLGARPASDAEGRRGQVQRGQGRAGLVLALAVLGGVGWFALRRSAVEAPRELTLAERYAADERIEPLLAGCTYGRPFEADTSAIVELLAAKLNDGAQLEPMRRAKQELANIGAPAARPLRRLFDEASRDIWRVAIVLNVLDVCALSEDPFGLPLAREALVSPREDVRLRASYVFAKHGTPEDYPALRDAFFATSNQETAQKMVPAMRRADLGLFHFEVPSYIDKVRVEVGGLAVSPLADTLAAEAADAVDPIVVDQLYELSAGLAPRQRAYMLAPSAAAPDAKHHTAALEELRGMLSDELVGPRQNAANAFARAGLPREIFPVLELDADPRLRTLAATLLAAAVEKGHISADEVREPLRRALATDTDDAVRSECLAALAKQGDPEAWDQVLRKFEGSIPDRDLAIRVAREAWSALPATAPAQARARLVQLLERRQGEGAPGHEIVSLLVALGAVPGRESAEILLDMGAKLGTTEVRGIAGHWWCVGQAYNAGPEARTVLRERLAVETDPLRRLDLISFVWQDMRPESVQALLDIAGDTARDPHERLYAAERSLHMHASERVAPFLKAVYWETTDPVLRQGLQCLLWVWFGNNAS